MMRIMKYIKHFWTDLFVQNSFYLLSIIIVILSCGNSAWAQSGIKVSGTVIDSETKEPVPFVNIYTRSLSGGTITNDLGKFDLTINKTDTLVFSAVGFDKYFFSLKQDDIRANYEVVVELNFKTYELEPVKVTAFRDLEQFKQDILDLNIPAKQNELTLNIPKTKYAPSPEGGAPGVVVTGAISALYNQFSKEGKELRKLDAYRKQESTRKSVTSKYNIEIVKRITNLSDEGARRFMEWCKFEEDYIVHATEYDITIAMIKCLDEFSKNDTLN